MSFYRFARATAILALLRRYRARLLRCVFVAAFALVTSWQYQDVAAFVDVRYPQWAGLVLTIKTLIIYAALLDVCWQFSRMIIGVDAPVESPPPKVSRAQVQTAASVPTASGRLEEIARKPSLRSRYDDILHKDLS